MASGLPCVITTGCNFPEASAVAKIVDIDAEQIADALISLLRNPLQAKDMGDRARSFILGNYTWDKVALKMIDVYNKIAKKKNKK
jgi:glycosyltransferase involved in cell wall biosynthesis